MSADRFLDTNVLAYTFDHDSPGKRTRSIEVLREDFVVSAQVLSELYVILTRKLTRRVPPADAATVIGRLSLGEVVPVTAALVAAATETSVRSQVSYWDALIIDAAVAGGCTTLLSEDLSDGQVIRGVRIENPFRGDPTAVPGCALSRLNPRILSINQPVEFQIAEASTGAVRVGSGAEEVAPTARVRKSAPQGAPPEAVVRSASNANRSQDVTGPT